MIRASSTVWVSAVARFFRAVALLLVALLLVALFASPFVAGVSQTPARGERTPRPPAERASYKIALELDFDARTFRGTERVRFVNRDSRSTNALYFHLYPNLRANGSRADAEDEPRLQVSEVRAVSTGQPLAFTLEDGGVVLRVPLRENLAAGASVEIEIRFAGSVPEIDADETSLPAHVIQQVGAALRDTRETRRARDTNFVSRGVMLLGCFFPVLAARDGGDWHRKVEASIGDTIFTDVADYDVNVRAPADVRLYTSGEDAGLEDGGRAFKGENLRGFALVAGRTLRAAERTVAGVSVRSVYAAEHEKVGLRVLGAASEAARIFSEKFGPLPFKRVTVAEAPLVAGLGSTEFAGLAVMASAFYVDFDSPSMRNLPEIVREQRASVEESLEFAVAQGVAHQWWGAAVGNDPEREPVLDEALAHWSALLYVRETHGEERARLAEDEQLRGVYQIYRTFGGEDMTAARAARDYRNSFQYAAIVTSKGALMFVALRAAMGDERFFRALRNYYEANRLEIAEMEDLRAAFVSESELAARRALTRTFTRWLAERRGDEDIAPPNPQLAAALGISVEQTGNARDRNAFSRLGRFFWRQMTRIR